MENVVKKKTIQWKFKRNGGNRGSKFWRKNEKNQYT